MSESGYVSWNNNQERQRAFAGVARGLSKAEPARASDIYFNVAPGNVSVRDSFGREDYELFRPGETLPTRPKEVIAASLSAYEQFSIVHNVIDLMGDFASRGIDLVHQNERVEKFYKEWFRQVNGQERSERFLNTLYRSANVVVKRQTAILKAQDDLKRTSAADIEVPEPIAVEQREIPWRYHFLNPLSLEVLAEDLVPLAGRDMALYGVRIPDNAAKLIKSPRTPEEKALVSGLPADIRQAVARGIKVIPLDPQKVSVFHYKKDDWKAWGTPILSTLLPDLMLLKKLKLADLAALDGAISCIRVWKLGNLDAKIMPSETLILRLAEMLNNNVGGGVMDFVWGPDIELLETSTEVHRFLGQAKYEPVLQAIFMGLGIPLTLYGTGEGGFTNNSLSLRTLVERLEYGRDMLRAFWEHEVRLVQRGMGFRFPARVVFDRLLSDEASQKQLVLGLWDRNLVSDEYVRDVIGAVPEIEDVRIRREHRRRQKGYLPPKASPFHDANRESSLEKIFAQSGAYSPSQFGLELEEKREGEESPTDRQAREQKRVEDSQPKGQPGQGRPLNSKDSQKRKQKVVKPRASQTFLRDVNWAEQALARIASLTTEAYLQATGKKSLRELADQEASDLENFKLALLCNLPFGSEVTQQSIARLMGQPLSIPPAVSKLIRQALGLYQNEQGKQASVEVSRRFSSLACALILGRGDDE